MAESKSDKEQRGRDSLEKAIREEYHRQGRDPTSREIDARLRKVQEHAEQNKMIK